MGVEARLPAGRPKAYMMDKLLSDHWEHIT
jgi:hypothetical protein